MKVQIQIPNISYKNIQIWEYISELINEQSKSQLDFYPWSVDLNLNVEIDSTERQAGIIERNTEQYKITIKLHPYQNNEHLNGKQANSSNK